MIKVAVMTDVHANLPALQAIRREQRLRIAFLHYEPADSPSGFASVVHYPSAQEPDVLFGEHDDDTSLFEAFERRDVPARRVIYEAFFGGRGL